jgi:hypothetical protein
MYTIAFNCRNNNKANKMRLSVRFVRVLGCDAPETAEARADPAVNTIAVPTAGILMISLLFFS